MEQRWPAYVSLLSTKERFLSVQVRNINISHKERREASQRGNSLAKWVDVLGGTLRVAN